MSTPTFIICICLLAIAALITLLVKVDRARSIAAHEANTYRACGELSMRAIERLIRDHRVSAKHVYDIFDELKQADARFDSIKVEMKQREEPRTQTCTKCGRVLPIEAFDKSGDYRRHVCKSCRNKARRKKS